MYQCGYTLCFMYVDYFYCYFYVQFLYEILK